MKQSAAAIFLTATAYALIAGSFAYANTSASSTYPVVLDVWNPVALNIQWAIPEGRVGASSTNWDTTFALTVRDTSNNPLQVQGDLATTSVDGTHLAPIIFNDIPDGNTYNISIKTTQHLSRSLNNIFLTDGINTLNFSQADNSTSSIGSVVLLAGDISGAGNSTTTLGDDVVNSVDLGILIDDLDAPDPTAHAYRANFNQDTVVNAVDLSLMINNLDKVGDQ